MSKRKPKWLKVRLQGSCVSTSVHRLMAEHNLNTVCIEANCPNSMECFENKSATFMIAGRHCTRDCKFCNVSRGIPDKLDLQEPEHISKAVAELGLTHVVITAVTRDDLPDQGAGHFVNVMAAIKQKNPGVTIEVLIPDLQGQIKELSLIINHAPDVLNHNLETVPSLYAKIRPMANYKRSLRVLEFSKELSPDLITKSGVMAGLGETKEELIEVFNDLSAVRCDILTIGQYLQPSSKHYPVQEYITPEVFDQYKNLALSAGIKKVVSGPLVRSSYKAAELLFK